MRFLIIIALASVAMAKYEETQFVSGNNKFSAKLFNEAAKNQPGKNVVVSGFSAMVPLAQLALGSVGSSHDEILEVIGLPNDEVAKDAFLAVNKNLRSQKAVQLNVANRVYVPEGLKLNQTYSKMSKEVFASDVKNVNFGNGAQAAREINAWVEEQTNHRIKDLVSAQDFSPITRALIVNAIHFLGTWVNKFDKSLTIDKDFHIRKDEIIKIPTMHKHAYFQYGHSEDLQAKLLELPYEGDDTSSSSFLVVLPDEVDGLAGLMQKLLDPLKLDNAISQMKSVTVDVDLPKFKIQTEVDLKNILPKVGIQKLFTYESNLNYVLDSPDSLKIDGAKQKAFIEVNEEGVEAAASTQFVGVGSAAPSPNVQDFHANRPFYFTLKSGNIALFSGVFYGSE